MNHKVPITVLTTGLSDEKGGVFTTAILAPPAVREEYCLRFTSFMVSAFMPVHVGTFFSVLYREVQQTVLSYLVGHCKKIYILHSIDFFYNWSQ